MKRVKKIKKHFPKDENFANFKTQISFE